MVAVKVDISAAFGVARDQGARPTCLAFATSDAHRYVRSRISSYLSSEYLFYYAAQKMLPNAHHRGVTTGAITTALQKEGQPLERHYVYLKALKSIDPLPDPPVPFPKKTYIGTANFTAGTTPDIIRLLDTNKATVLLLNITDQFRQLAGTPYVIQLVATDISVGKHAVVCVGYGHDSSGSQYLRIRNSWGNRWGDRGHAWLHEAYVNKQICGYGLVS